MGYKDIYKLQEIGGAKAKCDFIREHEDDWYFKRFLYFALNPLLTYNISKKSLEAQKVKSLSFLMIFSSAANIFHD